MTSPLKITLVVAITILRENFYTIGKINIKRGVLERILI